ncbi:MAG: lipid-binding SYLF domain-containing protein [Candidatus Sulfotelmatobacter sp.]
MTRLFRGCQLPRLALVLGANFLLFLGMAYAQNNGQDKDANSNSSSDAKQYESKENESSIEKRIDASARVLDSIMDVKDKAIPDKIMKDAKCIAVVPSMVRIAVGFGGEHGKGVATCRLPSGSWSSPAPVTITGGSWGLQLGGQAVDLVLVVMNKHGMDELLADKFKIGANASAAAGPVGRDAGASTDWKMKSDILTYSRARGVFAGVDLSGSVITQDKDETRVLYGKFVPFAEVLNGKIHPAPGEGDNRFEAAVRKYSEQAREREHGELNKASTNESASR